MNIKFYDKDGNIRPELFDQDALEIAHKLVNTTLDKWGKEKASGVSRHQFRRMFDEVKRLQKNQEDKGDWGRIHPMVKLLKSKIAYTVARMKKNNGREAAYYDSLEAFLLSGIDNIKKPEDLKVFTLLFEAVYGFYYNLGGAQTK